MNWFFEPLTVHPDVVMVGRQSKDLF